MGVDDDGVIILANTLAVNLFGYPREELIGQSIELIVPHSARTDEARRTGDLENSQTWPIASGLELEARAADGTEFPCEISLLLMEWKGARLSLAAIRDITDRRQVEEKLQLAAGRVQAATEIAVAVGSETDLGRVLETIVERARTLVEARALMLLLTQGDELVISAMAGDVDDALQGQRVKRTDDLLWEVFRLPSSATGLGSVGRMSACCRRSAPARRPRWRRRSRWRPRGCAIRSAHRSASGATGLASSMTRRCRGWPASWSR